MSLFLFVYDRRHGELVHEPREFPEDIAVANVAVLEAERAHPDMEVVLLQASSLDALKRTHGRYFGRGKDVIATFMGVRPDVA